jgi:hypothetical protein
LSAKKIGKIRTEIGENKKFVFFDLLKKWLRFYRSSTFSFLKPVSEPTLDPKIFLSPDSKSASQN